jgi:hypothetical protein
MENARNPLVPIKKTKKNSPKRWLFYGKCQLNSFGITPHILKQHIHITIVTHSQFMHWF